MRQATFNDLTKVLREQSEVIQSELDVPCANMCVPTDGSRLRIRVSVPEDAPGDLPSKIVVHLNDGSDLEVQLEITKDFEPFEPLQQ